MKKLLTLIVATAILYGPTCSAAHLSNFDIVDFINGTAAPGGGTFNGNLSAGNDDDWIAFFATAGDNVSFDLTTTASFTDAAIFREVTNGIIEIGDIANVTGFNTDRTGAGTDLVVQHAGWGVDTNYTFSNSLPETLNFLVATTGWHVLGISVNNEDSSRTGQWTATLTGNTSSVPGPGTLVLFAIGLAGLTIRQSARPS